MATTYNLYKNGTKSESGVTSPKALTGLTANTDYTFQIYAETDGVETPYSKVANVKTLPVVVTGVTIAPKTLAGVNGTAGSGQLTPTIAPTTATNKAVTYAITPVTTGLTVSTAGLVSWTTAVPAGTYTITVKTTDGNKTDTCVLTIAPIAVTGVTIAPKNATGTTGTAGTKQFTGTIAPTNAANKGMTYTISPTTAGYSIGASTGLVSWTDVAVPAVITVTVTTTDGSKTDTGTLTTTAP